MSSDEPDDPFANFRKNQAQVQQKQAGRSAADDVIEQVGDFKPPKVKRPGHCPQCESGDIRITRPLGGAPRNLCRGCGNRWLGSPRSPAPLVLAKNGPSQTRVKGPYYRGSAALPPKADRHQPTSRRKAKSLGALKKKAGE